MKHNEMLKKNSTDVFYQISRGQSTVEKLIKKLSISRATIEKICVDLVNKELVCSKVTKRDTPGRRAIKYSINPYYYSVFIEEMPNWFQCIFINSYGCATERFNKKKHSDVPLEEIVYRLRRDIIFRDEYEKYCMGIYIDCYEETIPLLPEYFIRVKKEYFVANALKNEHEIILFEFKHLCILSLYGKITPTNAKRRGIEHVFTPHKTISFGRQYYHEMFDAAKATTLEKMKDLI